MSNELRIQREGDDIVVIEGIRYSGELFRSFAADPPRTVVRIGERRDGTITLTRLDDYDELIEALRLVQAGLRSGSIKSKPIISFDSNAKNAEMQTLQEIIDALLAKHTPQAST